MKLVIAFLCFSLLGWGLLLYTNLNINRTESLPYQAFFCVKGLTLDRGDFVSISGHTTTYTSELSITKRLTGLAGDMICIAGDQVLVAGKSVGHLRSHTRDGRPLKPIKVRQIPPGYVFLSADHPHSFDSRYAEFGLVDIRCIQGKCFGLFKKGGE